MEQKFTVIGKVKKVTTFSNFVTLFIDASYPEEYRDKVIKIGLDTTSCQHLLKWAQLSEGDAIAVTRTQNDGIPRNRKYTLEVIKSDVIDMDDL